MQENQRNGWMWKNKFKKTPQKTCKVKKNSLPLHRF